MNRTRLGNKTSQTRGKEHILIQEGVVKKKKEEGLEKHMAKKNINKASCGHKRQHRHRKKNNHDKECIFPFQFLTSSAITLLHIYIYIYMNIHTYIWAVIILHISKSQLNI